MVAAATRCPPGQWTWRLAPCHEDGWHCLLCQEKAPGEPPGYRPDLDESEIEAKLASVLMDMTHAVELVYVSNNDQGESLIGMAAKMCRLAGHYDQYSIAYFLLGLANRTHADYWKRIGDGIRAGADPRDRCHCGKLAK